MSFTHFFNLRDKLNSKRKLGKSLAISLANQIVSSGTNFLLGVFLVRAMAPHDFGIYGIGFAAILLYGGIGNALLLTQMVVNIPSREKGAERQYAARILAALVIFCLICLLVLCFLVAGLLFFNFKDISPALFISVFICAASYLVKDYFVRYAYSFREEALALYANSAAAAITFLLVFSDWKFNHNVSPTNAVLSYAVGCICGSLLSFFLSTLKLRKIDRLALLSDISEAWQGGRWALLGVIVAWAQSQAYVYVTAWSLGPTGVGYANSARLLITPVTFLIPALSQIAIPRFASLQASNRQRMIKLSRQFSIFCLSVSILYSVCVLSTASDLIPIFLGKNYDGMVWLVAAWCAVVTLQFSRVGSSIVLQVLKEFRSLTLINISSVLLAIFSSVVMMKYFGVIGAVLGMAIGELVLSFLLHRLVSRKLAR